MELSTEKGSVFEFIHLTSTHCAADANQEPVWLTEVSSSNISGCLNGRSNTASSEGLLQSTPPQVSNAKASSRCKKKKEPGISFVNITGAPTKDERDRARKLATIARNVEEKERQRRELHSKIVKLVGSFTSSYKIDLSKPPILASADSNSPNPFTGSISRFGACRTDPFMKYPFKLSRRELQLMDHIFHEESRAIKPYKEAFFPIGLTDPAAFHQVLANITVQLDRHRLAGSKAEEYEKRQVVVHHAAALSMVQERLLDPAQATSEGTIATVIAMVCYSHLTRDFYAWHAHIKGLRYLLKLQQDQRDMDLDGNSGPWKKSFFGLDTLLGPALSWVDACGAASLDIPPRFPLHPSASLAPPPNSDYPPSPKALLLASQLLEAFPSGQTIFCLFKETAILISGFKATLAHSSPSQIFENPMWSWIHLYPLAHNLLSYRAPLDMDDYESIVKESCRLALSIFITEVRRKFGIAPLVLDVYVEQLQPLLFSASLTLHGVDGFQDFRLWMLVMGSMEARGEVRDKFVVLLRGLLGHMGIETHLQLKEIVSQLIWIDEVNEPAFLELEREIWGVIYELPLV